MPMPGIERSSRAVAGRDVAIAFSTLSLKMRNAGTPRRRASRRRQEFNASSMRVLGGAGAAALSLFVVLRRATDLDADFFARLRLRATAADAFMTNSIEVVSVAAEPCGVRLTIR